MSCPTVNLKGQSNSVQRLGLGDGREIEFLQPERQPNKELKVQKKYNSRTKNFQPGTKDEQ